MRAFVALEVPNNVVHSLVVFQKELEATGADIKLVEKENLHLNLRFLGEITETQGAQVASRLGGLSIRGVKVKVRGAGAFPGPGRPRVVWAGIARGDEGLLTPIAESVSTALEGIGERDDRPFRAHITLGRVRSPRNFRDLAEFLRANSEREFGVADISELKFKSSLLTPAGPVYKDLGVYHLG
jgi:2'-5' RNA ligase